MRMGEGQTDRETDMTKLIVSFPNSTNSLESSQDGAEFDCAKPECEKIGEREREREREMNEAGARWRRTKNKHSSLREALSLSLSLPLYF